MSKYICPQCHNEVAPDDKFCMNCGANLELIGKIEVEEPKPTKIIVNSEEQKPNHGFKIHLQSMNTNEQDTRIFKEGFLVIGRKSDVDNDELFWGIDDEAISPRHVKLTIEGSSVIVEDLHSLNGVYKRLMEPTILEKTEYILIGATFFRFQKLDPPDPTEAKMYISPMEKYPIATLTTVLMGGRNGQTYPIYSLPFKIGREEGDLTFPSDRFLSGEHMLIDGTPEKMFIQDLNSRNGTYIRIKDRDIVQHGDWLCLGRHLFMFEGF